MRDKSKNRTKSAILINCDCGFCEVHVRKEIKNQDKFFFVWSTKSKSQLKNFKSFAVLLIFYLDCNHLLFVQLRNDWNVDAKAKHTSSDSIETRHEAFVNQTQTTEIKGSGRSLSHPEAWIVSCEFTIERRRKKTHTQTHRNWKRQIEIEFILWFCAVHTCQCQFSLVFDLSSIFACLLKIR